MKRITRAWLIAAAVLLPFVLLAVLLPALLDLTGGLAWVARGLLFVLGLAAALIVFFYLRARAKALPEPVKQDDEIDSAIVQARKRLAAAKGGAKLGRVPVVLFVGPAGSTKTTVVTRSGLEPELLAGEVVRGDAVVPTRALNLWYADDAVLVEAGGKLLTEPARWARLVKHLRPARLAALLPGRGQAPRSAVVCLGCDELMKPGAGESVPALAQTIRARLIELAGGLGVRLPVYVVFTKADRLPYFADYVRSWTTEETSELLGATLPLAARAETGSYAEREAARVNGAIDGIFRSLASRRLTVLPRESAEEVRAGAYEFPRELRKAAPLATQFLVDLCRPSQLGVSPFLRGFYFTGVRPLVIEEAGYAPASPAAPRSGAVDATSVFDARAFMAQQQAGQHGGQSAPRGTRRVPEWAFLRRLLGGIVLRDGVARAVTAGGTRINFLRRALVGGAAAALVLLCVAFFVSWRANDGLIDRTRTAADSVSSVDLAGGGVPTMEDLTRLDTLRARLAQLRAWDTAGPPMRYRWGLYAGDEVLDTLRALYFHRFERMLWSSTRGKLIASLQALPARPNEASEYGLTYDALKSYLITTSHPHESTVEFLSPALMHHWQFGREVDAERAAVAERQFAFFASELPFGNPYAATAEDPLVARTRVFLRAFGDTAQFYQALIAEASKAAQPVRYPGDATVTDNVVVPGAFTGAGWTFVQDNLSNLDRLFARESWVLGDATVPEGDRARIANELRQRYVTDYIDQWQSFLAGAQVVRYNGAQDASRKLLALSSNQSPLLRLLSIAAQNTGVDTTVVADAFQPVHAVVPAEPTDRLTTESNQPYMQGLIGLQAAIDQVATAQGAAREAAIGNASSTADQIKTQVQGMALTFNVEGEAQPVAAAVQRLLLAPVTNVEGLLTALPSADTNARGASFCQVFTPVMRRYPFARGGEDAAPEEVNAIFKPRESALWSFYEQQLSGLLVPRGSGYGAAIGAPLQPTDAFVTFFNRAAEISRGLYTPEGSSPEAVFDLRPLLAPGVTEVRVEIDGQIHTVNATMQGSRPFLWQAATSRSARISASVNGAVHTVAEGAGPWSVFHLFDGAQWTRVSAGQYRLTWPIPATNATLAAELRFEEQIPIFMPGYFGNVGCVGRIVAR